MTSGLSTLLAPIDPGVLDELRHEWDWVIPQSLRVVGLTVLGDWLLEDSDGAMHLLETIEATITKIAGSRAELEAEGHDPPTIGAPADLCVEFVGYGNETQLLRALAVV